MGQTRARRGEILHCLVVVVTEQYTQIYIFVAEGVKSNDTTLPLVELPGVDDSYPPQKKSFAMLRAMADYGLGR